MPEPLGLNGTELSRYAGRYVEAFKEAAIDIDVHGRRLRARLVPLSHDEAEDATRLAPFHMAPFDTDKMLIQGGRLDGLRAEFLRDGRNQVRWIRFGARLWRKTPAR